MFSIGKLNMINIGKYNSQKIIGQLKNFVKKILMKPLQLLGKKHLLLIKTRYLLN